jgi:hypothetical protein
MEMVNRAEDEICGKNLWLELPRRHFLPNRYFALLGNHVLGASSNKRGDRSPSLSYRLSLVGERSKHRTMAHRNRSAI